MRHFSWLPGMVGVLALTTAAVAGDKPQPTQATRSYPCIDIFLPVHCENSECCTCCELALTGSKMLSSSTRLSSVSAGVE